MDYKSYILVHTKPLFNEHKIINYYHTFMEIFKVLQYSIPCSLKQLLNLCPRNQKFLLMTPKVNFAFKVTKVLKKFIGNALERNLSANYGLIIPGYARNSDLSAFIAYFVKMYIQNFQKLGHIFYGDKFAIFNLIKFDFSGSHAY